MKTEQIASIPLNRAWLQFCATRIGPEKIQVDYELCLPLNEVDCRGTFDHKVKGLRPKSHNRVWLDKNNVRHFPLGRTGVGSTNPDYPFSRHNNPADGPQIDLPFRDGAHCGWDNAKLGLEIYYRLGAIIYHLIPEANKENVA